MRVFKCCVAGTSELPAVKSHFLTPELTVCAAMTEVTIQTLKLQEMQPRTKVN